MDILGKSGLGLELAKQGAVVKVPGVLPFDGIGAAALAYLDQKKRAEAAEAEVERLKGVLEEIANTLKYAPDDEGVKALYDFARSALEAKP